MEYKTSSTTCLTLELGIKELIIRTGLDIQPHQKLDIGMDMRKNMQGIVEAYNPIDGYLLGSISIVTGEGTYCNWTVIIK